MSAEEEYEPGANDDTGGYVPGESQSEEYTVTTNGEQDAYKPSVAFIQSNYVSCFEQKNSDSGFDKQSSSSSGSLMDKT